MNKKQTRGKFGAVGDILTTLRILGIESDLFHTMLDEVPVNLWVHDENNTIVYGNKCFRENFGAFQNRMCHQCLMGEEGICSCCLSKEILKNKEAGKCELCRRVNAGYDINLFHTPVIGRKGKVFILKSSLHVKDLGILSEKYFSETENRDGENKIVFMCASCKRIQDQDKNWIAVDDAILNCFNVSISHSICRECVPILYPEVDMRGL